MQTINIAVCEDDANDAGALRGMIAGSGLSADVFVYGDAGDFISEFHPGFFQLVFLDIYFDGSITTGRPDGLDAAVKIRETDPDVWIVFTTVSPDHAQFGYTVNADRYITKPLDGHEVRALLRRAGKHFDRASDEIILTVDRKKRGLRMRDIRYVEVFDKKCVIYLKDEKVASYTKIDEMEELLKLPSFLRCHRSFIVNMDYIEAYDGRDFIMSGGGKAYIGHLIQWKVRKTYREYITRLARGERL